jgi:membrane-associated phospholipid phosphatase
VRLVEAALRVGQLVAMHYKARWNRPRPSQLSPALMPPVPTPRHPAYPSAHATEAYLVAHALGQVMPSLAKTHPNGVTRNALLDVADRIARNREVLGLHYPSDSECGRRLAEAAFPLLQACPTLAGPNGLIALAQAEWAGTS